MPGLVNTHTHAAMACFRGLADDLTLMQWLQEYIFPVEAKLNSKMVYQSTVLSIAEMIKSGTTSFCDMYLFAKDVARAAADTGMRAWIGEVLHDFPSPSYGKLESGFTYVDELFSMYADHPLLNITVDPMQSIPVPLIFLKNSKTSQRNMMPSMPFTSLKPMMKLRVHWRSSVPLQLCTWKTSDYWTAG